MLGILGIQALLSLRLLSSNMTFRDEALCLWTWQLEWSHWLHGAQVSTYFPTFLSGAPVVYPPLAALANAAGGLAAASGLSLCFMLGATTLLYGVAGQIFDRRAALFAAGLFAGVGSVQFLGGLATYDALALFLMAAAAWPGIRAPHSASAAQHSVLVSCRKLFHGPAGEPPRLIAKTVSGFGIQVCGGRRDEDVLEPIR